MDGRRMDDGRQQRMIRIVHLSLRHEINPHSKTSMFTVIGYHETPWWKLAAQGYLFYCTILSTPDVLYQFVTWVLDFPLRGWNKSQL